MKGASTAFSAIVLLGSTLSIVAGFAGGRTVVAAGALPAPPPGFVLPPPAPIEPEKVTRVLTGVHSLDAADELDPYGDPTLGVAAHPWSSAAFDARTERAKIAILVVDGSRAGPGARALHQFVAPVYRRRGARRRRGVAGERRRASRGENRACRCLRGEAGAQVEALARDAQGVIGSLSAPAARALVRVLPHDALVVDAALREDDRLADAARAPAYHLLWRDVIADARNEKPYVDFMLRDALAIAQRHGFAIVLVHARSQTFDALKRFADRARRDGADIVPITALGTI